MLSLRINKGRLISEVHVPPSKSYANRALILAALTKRTITLSNLPTSTDVTILIQNLKDVGLTIEEVGSALKITNSFPECESGPKTIYVGEGGTTARFLAGFLLNGTEAYELILGERLKERPWNEFLELVKSLGGKAELVDASLKLQGPVHLPQTLEIDCSKTTQFASSFQLAFSSKNHQIVPINMNSSQSYWAMTERLIEDFRTTDDYSIPLDWSSASYPLAFGALAQEITFPRLKFDPYQSDAKFYEILKSFGSLTQEGDTLKIRPYTLTQNLCFDVSDALDLVPTLCFFLAHVEGQHELQGINNLIYKESDRLSEVIKLLGLFGKKSWSEGHSLFIEGTLSREPHEIHLTLPNDHRMVMVGTLFLLLHAGGTIAPTSAVDKSYPDFFNLVSKT